jgi:hypothetical protein
MEDVKFVSRENLGHNQSIIVDSTDVAVEECTFPVKIEDFEPTVRQTAEAVKCIIDSGISGKRIIFARMVETTDVEGQKVKTLMLTGNEKDFAYQEGHNLIKVLKEYPTVIGFSKSVTDPTITNRLHIGDIFIRVSFGHYVSLQQWEEMSRQRTRQSKTGK